MKKATVLFLILFLWFLMPASVIATDSSSHDLQQLREYISKHWPSVFTYHASPSPHPTKAKHESTERQFDNIHNVAMTMLEKYEQRHAHYGDFLKKLHTRRNKLHDEGADVSHIDTLITNATSSHAQTLHVLEAEKTWLASVDETADWQLFHGNVVSNIGQLHQAFTNEHVHMTNVVQALRKETVNYHSLEPTSVHNNPKLNPTIHVPPPQH